MELIAGVRKTGIFSLVLEDGGVDAGQGGGMRIRGGHHISQLHTNSQPQKLHPYRDFPSTILYSAPGPMLEAGEGGMHSLCHYGLWGSHPA